MNDAYMTGFLNKCAEYGVDAELLLKQAVRGDMLSKLLANMSHGLHYDPSVRLRQLINEGRALNPRIFDTARERMGIMGAARAPGISRNSSSPQGRAIATELRRLLTADRTGDYSQQVGETLKLLKEHNIPVRQWRQQAGA